MPARTIKQIYENSILLAKRTFPKSINGGKIMKYFRSTSSDERTDQFSFFASY